ncbi:MAG: hypothetical protein QM673_15805 [Gordonia sp. (in: high G+C Gram-positive bacteria)]
MPEPSFIFNIDPPTLNFGERPFDDCAVDAFRRRYLTASADGGLSDARGRRVTLAQDTIAFDATPTPDDAPLLYDALHTIGGTLVGAHLPVAISTDLRWLGAPRPPTGTALVVARSVESVRAALELDSVHAGIYGGPENCVHTLRHGDADTTLASAFGGGVRVLIDSAKVEFSGPWFASPQVCFFEGQLVDLPPSATTARWCTGPTELTIGRRYASHGWELQASPDELRITGNRVELIIQQPQHITMSPIS